MHQTVCTSLVLNILAFTLLFTIFKYSVTRCYMKGLLCNIVRVHCKSVSDAISLNGISFRDTWDSHDVQSENGGEWYETFMHAFRRNLSRNLSNVEKKTKEKKKKETNALMITNCFFYPTNNLTHGCYRQKQDFFYKFYSRTVLCTFQNFIFRTYRFILRLSLPDRFPHCACPRWRRSVIKSLKKSKGPKKRYEKKKRYCEWTLMFISWNM